MQLFTIGYEGITPTHFLGLLLDYGVEVLVDVREMPISRKKGFSKESLRSLVTSVGIEYQHVKALGCPTPIRHTYREDGDWKRYTEKFLRYLTTQDITMQALCELTQKKRCSLLCFEADPYRCHRSLVSQRLLQRWDPQLSIIHITTNHRTIAKETWVSAQEVPMHL